MTYTDPRDGSQQDTDLHSWPLLIGLLKFLHRHSASNGWVEVNGPDAMQRLARSVRARAFREGKPIAGYLRAILNHIDPPRCRCGRPGTRIMSGTTFCSSCGPTARQMRGRAWRANEAGYTEWDAQFKADEQDRLEKYRWHVKNQSTQRRRK